MKKFIRTGWLTILAAICLIFAMPENVKADAQQESGQQIDNNDKSFNKNPVITIQENEIFTATESYIWISYTADANGYLTLDNYNVGDIPANGYLALYNNTKSVALSSKSIGYSGRYPQNAGGYWGHNVFGMQKGQTYYIRVKAYTPVTFASSFTKVKDKSGATQKKALNIKRNKKKTGLIPAGVTTPDWYKIKLNKAKKIKLHYNVQTKGSVRLTFYLGGTQLGSKVISSQGAQKMTLYVKRTNSKGKIKKTSLKKGTYYIKVEPANSITSCYYTLKWK